MSTTFEVQCYVSEGVQRLRLWNPLSRIDPAFRRDDVSFSCLTILTPKTWVFPKMVVPPKHPKMVESLRPKGGKMEGWVGYSVRFFHWRPFWEMQQATFLIEEILHHLGFTRPRKFHGINSQPQLVNAGFLIRSIVSLPFQASLSDSKGNVLVRTGFFKVAEGCTVDLLKSMLHPKSVESKVVQIFKRGKIQKKKFILHLYSGSEGACPSTWFSLLNVTWKSLRWMIVFSHILFGHNSSCKF